MSDKEKPGDTATSSADANTDTDKKDLNSLLASWDDEPKGDKDKPKGDDSALAKEVARLSYEREMDKLIPMVKGDLKVSDKFVETYMNMRADEDPRLNELWENRHKRRADFDKAMTALGEDLKKELGKPNDDTPPEKSGSLAAAIHAAKETGAAGGELDGLDFSTMSDTEFGFKKAEIFRLAEQGKLTPG